MKIERLIEHLGHSVHIYSRTWKPVFHLIAREKGEFMLLSCITCLAIWGDDFQVGEALAILHESACD